jgi:hypothetical protein
MASSNDLEQLLLQVGLLGKPTETKMRSECSSRFAWWTDSNHSIIVQLSILTSMYGNHSCYSSVEVLPCGLWLGFESLLHICCLVT